MALSTRLDYTVWRNRFGTALGAADANGNGTVDDTDFTIWRRNYGNADLEVGSAGSSPVPEPTHCCVARAALLAVGVAALVDLPRNDAPPLAIAGRSLEFGHGRVR